MTHPRASRRQLSLARFFFGNPRALGQSGSSHSDKNKPTASRLA